MHNVESVVVYDVNVTLRVVASSREQALAHARREIERHLYLWPHTIHSVERHSDGGASFVSEMVRGQMERRRAGQDDGGDA